MSDACVRQVHDFSFRWGLGFWVGRRFPLKIITATENGLTAALRRCGARDTASDRLVVVDIGAGIHGMSETAQLHGNRLHPDDSDSLWLLKGLRHLHLEVSLMWCCLWPGPMGSSV